MKKNNNKKNIDKFNPKRIGKMMLLIGLILFVLGVVLFLFVPSGFAFWIAMASVVLNILGITFLTLKIY